MSLDYLKGVIRGVTKFIDPLYRMCEAVNGGFRKIKILSCRLLFVEASLGDKDASMELVFEIHS